MPTCHRVGLPLTIQDFLEGRDTEDCDLRLAWENSSQDPISKIPHTKKGCRVAEVVECLLGKCEALNSSPVLSKKKRKIQSPKLVYL
jgi:hypothetical protein